jgi:hypothetical protein
MVGNGEVENTVEKPRPFNCLIRSVRDRDGMSGGDQGGPSRAVGNVEMDGHSACVSLEMQTL